MIEEQKGAPGCQFKCFHHMRSYCNSKKVVFFSDYTLVHLHSETLCTGTAGRHGGWLHIVIMLSVRELGGSKREGEREIERAKQRE